MRNLTYHILLPLARALLDLGAVVIIALVPALMWALAVAIAG